MKKKLNSKDPNYLLDKGIDINNLCNGTTLKAQEIAVVLIKITYGVIDSFPACEEHILKSQLRGSVQGVLACLAEGNSQLYTKRQIQFLSFTLGSLAETESHYLIALNLKYITKKQYEEIEDLINQIKKLVVTYINLIIEEMNKDGGL